MTVVESKTNNTTPRTYKFIYDIMQMSMTKATPGMSGFRLKVKFVFLWVMLPALIITILVLIAARYCFKNSVGAVTNIEFVEEMGGPPVS